MKKQKVLWAASLVLLTAGCANRRGEGTGREPEDVELGRDLADVESSSIPLADAIRDASARAEGFVAVAAGPSDEDDDTYDIAFFEKGRVKQISVDAHSGSVERIRDRAIRPGSEAFAAQLEKLLPEAKIDLARAVEVALATNARAKAIGADVDSQDGVLVYQVTMRSGPKALLTTVDAKSGTVVRVDVRASEGEMETDEADERPESMEEGTESPMEDEPPMKDPDSDEPEPGTPPGGGGR